MVAAHHARCRALRTSLSRACRVFFPAETGGPAFPRLWSPLMRRMRRFAARRHTSASSTGTPSTCAVSLAPSHLRPILSSRSNTTKCLVPLADSPSHQHHASAHSRAHLPSPFPQEKGTVYNEMLASFQQADFCGFHELNRLVYGRGHPLGFEAGGTPQGIRSSTPEAMRRFHGARYRLENMGAQPLRPMPSPHTSQCSPPLHARAGRLATAMHTLSDPSYPLR